MIVTLTLLALLGWLLLAEPLLGRRSFRQLARALDRGEQGVRARFLWRWTAQGWALVAVTLAIALGVAGWTPAQLGLAWPRAHASIGGGLLAGIAVGMLGGIALAALATRRRARRRPATTPPPIPPAVLRMLPRTGRERIAFAALAVTAGVGEEIVWRGFGLALLRSWLPSAHPAWWVLLLALAFGWAHLYQGRAGVLATALVGAVLAAICVVTASLLVPMVLHVLIDLRALLISVPPDGDRPRADDDRPDPSTREVS